MESPLTNNALCRRLENIQSEIRKHEHAIAEHRLLIDALLSESCSILSSVVVSKLSDDIELHFEGDQRTITWNGGCLKLGHKSYVFIKTLWGGNRHTASVDKIERRVWLIKQRKKRVVKIGNRTIKTDTVSRNTFNSFLQRLRNELRGNFPYKITPIKSRETREIAAYRLKRTKLFKKIFENAQ
jgi:hypothetical protein